MSKKKVLMVVEAFGGGVFTYLEELSKSLINDFDIYIAFGKRKQTPIDFRKHFSTEVHFLEVKHFQRSISIKEDLLALFELRRIVKEVDPDIIHLHSSKAGILGRWGLNGNKIPIFYTPHGYSFLMEDASRFKRAAYWLVERMSAWRNCTTIGCSAGEYAEAKKLSSKAELISNGVDTTELDEILGSRSDMKTNSKSVITLGRVCFQKNPLLFNKIAERLPDYKFVWIGDGELRDELTAPNIKVTGWLDREAAVKELSTAEVFMLPSLWEGLPISLLEAMYLNCVCVVSDVVGNRDVITNKTNGFVCENIEDFVHAIESAELPDASELANQAHLDILEHYNTIKMSEEYEEIYSSCLTERHIMA
ncbi:glycosyltransferase [Lacticaseibacillus suilingensis]|uniref:Glycosyltransferase n=1 Tax=Lacticaseibacillus suilingensis TaxID=2799577 RepID=A0ABW4BH58_9LACO|nr:glycosyltransferase [Lacticaseibacillus suilingensis]